MRSDAPAGLGEEGRCFFLLFHPFTDPIALVPPRNFARRSLGRVENPPTRARDLLSRSSLVSIKISLCISTMNDNLDENRDKRFDERYKIIAARNFQIVIAIMHPMIREPPDQSLSSIRGFRIASRFSQSSEYRDSDKESTLPREYTQRRFLSG